MLELFHKTPDDPQGTHAQFEYRQIKRQLELEAQEGFQGLVQIFRKPSLRKRMLYGFLLQCITQSTGILVIFNYQVCWSSNAGLPL